MIAKRPARIALGSSFVAITLAVGLAAPALGALRPGWRIVFRLNRGPTSSFSAVTAISKHDAWAFGSRGAGVGQGRPLAYQWRGRGWRARALPSGLNASINAASAPAADDIWAVSDQGGYILHYNGTRWSVATKRFTTFGELTGVAAFSPSNVWVFGGPGGAPGFGTWHYNGHAWAKVIPATDRGIVTASPLSRSNMWAIGAVSSPEDAIFHYTGRWRQAKSSALSGLQFSGIVAVAAGNVWATANKLTGRQTSFLVHLTRAGWVRIRLPWSVSVGQLATDGHGGFWLTGMTPSGQSWVIHRSAAGHWSRRLIAGGGFGVFGLANIPGTASMWGAGGIVKNAVTDGVLWAYGKIA